jgi:hypothetical protein
MPTAPQNDQQRCDGDEQQQREHEHELAIAATSLEPSAHALGGRDIGSEDGRNGTSDHADSDRFGS